MPHRHRVRYFRGLLAVTLLSALGAEASAGEPARPSDAAPHLTGGAQFMFGVGLYGRKLDPVFYAGGIGRVGVQVAPRWALLAEPALFFGLAAR